MLLLPPEGFWDISKRTQGALSCAEALAIIQVASSAPTSFGYLSSGDSEPGDGALWLEMGVHKGKSAMSAICGAKLGVKTRFVLLEPEFENEEWETNTREVIMSVSRIANRDIDAIPSPAYSTGYLTLTNEKYSYVFVDSGSHQDGLPMAEAKLLEDRIVPGGIIAWHDWGSQFLEVTAAYEWMLSTGKYEEVPINWQEIIQYAEAHNLEDGTNSSWHHNELKHPCFVGALRRKK